MPSIFFSLSQMTPHHLLSSYANSFNQNARFELHQRPKVTPIVNPHSCRPNPTQPLFQIRSLSSKIQHRDIFESEQISNEFQNQRQKFLTNSKLNPFLPNSKFRITCTNFLSLVIQYSNHLCSLLDWKLSHRLSTPKSTPYGIEASVAELLPWQTGSQTSLLDSLS